MERDKATVKGAQLVNSLTRTSDIVILHSNDGRTFYVNKDVACQAKHIENLLQSRFKEGQTGEISLDMPTQTLETVIKYLHYRIINKDLAQEERAVFELKP
jgi:arginyl-tRNA synthetase